MRFICDVMLGKLAKYLRLLGLDAVYLRDEPSPERPGTDRETYVFLTRRTKPVPYARVIVLRSERVREQVMELKDFLKPFIDPEQILNRCIICNLPLEHAERSDVEHKVPEFVFHYYRSFKRCSSCNRVYWAGSHARGMSELIRKIVQ